MTTTHAQETSIRDSHPFIVKVGHHQYVQAPRVRVTWLERRRVKRDIAGMFNEVERVGWDRSQLHVQAQASERYQFGRADERVVVLRPNGLTGQNAQGTYEPATAAGVKRAVRRIRAQEAERIDRIDRAIGGLQAELQRLRADRTRAVAEAWAKGHVVRLQDAKPRGDEPRWLAAEATQ